MSDDVLVCGSFEDLVASAGSVEIDITFPIDRRRQGARIDLMRAMISSPQELDTGALWWYFGLTRDPKTYPAGSVDFWHDPGTVCRLQYALYSGIAGAAYSHIVAAEPEEIRPGLIVPQRVLGVFFNSIGKSRRFMLEIYYTIVELNRTQALVLFDKWNRRG